MSEEVVNSLYYLAERDRKLVIEQTPYSGSEGLIKKVKSVRKNDRFVKWVPDLDKQIDDAF